MLKRIHWRIAIVVSILLGSGWTAEAQELTVDGNVTATSFTGDGSSLTGVPADVFHGITLFNCPAGNTCFIVDSCPTDFEITGGGFFIGSANLSDRQMVTLHQSYRANPPTQWIAEATNGSAVALDFYTLADCARVASSPPLAPPVASLPPDLDLSRVLLVCPESDTARFVDPQDASGDHFCPNHGLALRPSGGGSSEILPVRGAKTDETTTQHATGPAR